MNTIRRPISPEFLHFKYTANDEHRKTLHHIDIDMTRTLEVVGDPEMGCYEWMILEGGNVLAHSDCGYGSPDIALRDGLIYYHGQPHDLGHYVSRGLASS